MTVYTQYCRDALRCTAQWWDNPILYKPSPDLTAQWQNCGTSPGDLKQAPPLLSNTNFFKSVLDTQMHTHSHLHTYVCIQEVAPSATFGVEEPWWQISEASWGYQRQPSQFSLSVWVCRGPGQDLPILRKRREESFTTRLPNHFHLTHSESRTLWHIYPVWAKVLHFLDYLGKKKT